MDYSAVFTNTAQSFCVTPGLGNNALGQYGILRIENLAECSDSRFSKMGLEK